MTCFGLKPSEEISKRALEGETTLLRPSLLFPHSHPSSPLLPSGILSAIHDELCIMVRNLAPASSRTKGSAHRALRALVAASWKGLMSTIQLMALNQAGFRPLTAEVRGQI